MSDEGEDDNLVEGQLAEMFALVESYERNRTQLRQEDEMDLEFDGPQEGEQKSAVDLNRLKQPLAQAIPQANIRKIDQLLFSGATPLGTSTLEDSQPAFNMTRDQISEFRHEQSTDPLNDTEDVSFQIEPIGGRVQLKRTLGNLILGANNPFQEGEAFMGAEGMNDALVQKMNEDYAYNTPFKRIWNRKKGHLAIG